MSDRSTVLSDEATARDLENAATLLREGVTDSLVPAIFLGSGQRQESVDEAFMALRHHLGVRHISTWYHRPGRTASEVISALEAAASRYRGQS